MDDTSRGIFILSPRGPGLLSRLGLNGPQMGKILEAHQKPIFSKATNDGSRPLTATRSISAVSATRLSLLRGTRTCETDKDAPHFRQFLSPTRRLIGHAPVSAKKDL